MRHYKIKYPDYINEVSEVIGRKRREASTEVRMLNKRYQCETLEKEIRIDVMGVRGEMIASHFFFMNGIEHKLSKLVEEEPIPGPDIVAKGKDIDVKSVPIYGKLLTVPVYAHNKKKMDYYMFVKPLENNLAEIWLIEYDQVDSWPEQILGGGHVKFKPIKEVNNAKR